MFFVLNVFSITAIFLYYITDYALALSKEAILSGFPVPPAVLTYHASIVAVENGSHEYHLVGGGAIISESCILTSAIIFLEANGDLQEKRFSVVVGTNNMHLAALDKIDIVAIFFPSFDSTFLYFNIAVASLQRGVGLGRNPLVRSLKIPYPDGLFHPDLYVTGFGFYQVITKMHSQLNIPIVTNGTLSPVLRFRRVTILSDDECKLYYPADVTLSNICGKMHREVAGERAVGVCKGDRGSPLVISDLLVGLVSFLTFDCDNTQVPALYTKTSIFKHSIDNFVNGIVSPNAFIRVNRQYNPLQRN